MNETKNVSKRTRNPRITGTGTTGSLHPLYRPRPLYRGAKATCKNNYCCMPSNFNSNSLFREECLYRIQWNVLHPLLVGIGKHGASESLQGI